eukprot:Nk52_evm107s221 gene=Nk52_evmTU107s221
MLSWWWWWWKWFMVYGYVTIFILTSSPLGHISDHFSSNSVDRTGASWVLPSYGESPKGFWGVDALQTLHVSSANTNAGTGTSGDPFKTIQQATAAAAGAGQDVLINVAPGTYNPNETPSSNNGIDFTGLNNNNFKIDITSSGTNATTFIVCSTSGLRALKFSGTPSSGTTFSFKGFTFKDCLKDGIANIGGTPKITFEQCTFTNCNIESTSTALGMFEMAAASTLTFNSIYAYNLKALSSKSVAFVRAPIGGVVTVSSSDFFDIQGAGDGSLFNVEGSTQLTVTGSKFSDLTATGDGGWANIETTGAVTVSSSHFKNMRSGDDAGVFEMSGATAVTVRDSTFNNCSSFEKGGVFQLGDTAVLTMESSTIVNSSSNTGGIGYSKDSSQFHGNHLLFNSSSASVGGHLAAKDNAKLNLNNVTLFSGLAVLDGGCIRVENAASMDMKNSVGQQCRSYLSGGLLSSSTTGVITIDNSTFTSNIASQDGGLIWATRKSPIPTSAILVVTNSRIVGTSQGGIGCIFITAFCNAQIKDTTIVGGTSGYSGGAVACDGASKVDLSRVKIQNCFSPLYGGGILVTKSASLNLQDSEVDSCRAVQGGAMYVNGQSFLLPFFTDMPVVFIKNTTFHNNSISSSSSNNYGGAIFSVASTLTIEDSRFVGNRNNLHALTHGGALSFTSLWLPFQTPGILNIKNSVFHSNTAGLGGALDLWIRANNQTSLTGNQFVNNTAKVGSSIYFSDVPQQDPTTTRNAESRENSETNPLIASILASNTFANNTSSQGGDQFSSPPRKYKVESAFTSVKIGETKSVSLVVQNVFNATVKAAEIRVSFNVNGTAELSNRGNIFTPDASGRILVSFFIAAPGPGTYRVSTTTTTAENFVFGEEFSQDVIVSSCDSDEHFETFSGTNLICVDDSPLLDSRQVLFVSFAAAVVFLAIVLVVYFWWYMPYKRMEELKTAPWLIPFDSIVIIKDGRDTEESCEATETKSKWTMKSELSHVSNSSSMYRLHVHGRDLAAGDYNGIVVLLTFLRKQFIDLSSRPLREDLHKVFKLRHPNLNPLIGVCIQSPNICIVTQFSSKGSLTDVMQDWKETGVDGMFKTSWCLDLANGLSYLHTKYGPHGNLRSSKCLINSRWGLSITGFGLAPFKDGETDDISFENNEKHAYDMKFKQLWVAPELLSSMKYQSRSTPSATLPGDVYSYGIVANYIQSGEEPYEDLELDINLVLDGIENGGLRPLPFKSSSGVQKILKEIVLKCWDPDQYLRPHMKSILALMKEKAPKVDRVFDKLISMMEKYSNELKSKVETKENELQSKREEVDNFLSSTIPKPVLRVLKTGQSWEARSYPLASVLVLDIVKFSKRIESLAPAHTAKLLIQIDHLIYDLMGDDTSFVSLETTGDVYMIASGLPETCGDKHAFNLCDFGSKIQPSLRKIYLDNVSLDLSCRIGISTAGALAGICGARLPRFFVLGNVMSTALRIEMAGAAGKIRVSEKTKELAELHDSKNKFEFHPAGPLMSTGSVDMETYWLS